MQQKGAGLIIAFILAGFTATVTQVLLIRELVDVFSGNELSLGIIFSSWLFWVACGSLVLGQFADRVRIKIKLYLILQVLLSVFLFPTLFGVRAIRVFWNIPPGEIIGFFPFLISVFFLLAPSCLILGFQFALACRLYLRKDFSPESQMAPRAVGRVYLFDAFGDMLGGIFFAYLFVNIFHSFAAISVLAVLNLSLAVILSLLFVKEKKFLLLFTGLSLLLLSAVVSRPAVISRLNNYTHRLEWKGMLLERTLSSKHGNYAVLKDGASFYVYRGGQLLFSVPEQALPEEKIHLAFSQTENPRRILLIGGGASGALKEALKYANLKEIVYLEKDPLLINLAQKYISPENQKALAASRTRIVFGDGRLFVKRYQGGQFDGIILNTGNPLTAEANRFYTLEFFREAKRILRPGGVFFLGIDSHENYLSPEMRKFNRSIYRTLKKVFPHVVLFPGDTLYLASALQSDFLTDNPQVISERLERQEISSQYINEYTLPDRLSPERISYIQGILLSGEKEGERLNRDFHPISYYYNLILWGSKISPKGFPRIFWQLSRIKISRLAGILMLVFSALIILRRKTRKGLIPLAVSIGGMAGISLELILIIGFQIIYGNLYFMIGIIVASFMLGLVAGAGFITGRLEKIRKKFLALARIELALGIYVLFVALSLWGLNSWRTLPSFVSVQVLFPLLTVFSGFWVGMIFPLANRIYLTRVETVGRTAGRLYAFDLLGACFGSLVTTVFLVPLFGLIRASLLIGLICSLGFLLVLNARER